MFGLSLLYAITEVSPACPKIIVDIVPQAEGVQQAFHLDSLRASHPIEVPVRNALEVDQIFDHISYLKGSSVIRMLSVHLGQERFLRGVADYLKSHAYGM
jgi:aminopeptidase N